MDTQQLDAFVAVAETGSFSIAAERIHLTQPAVSKRVAQLEQQLNCRLFDRIARHTSLTESGKALLPRARAILQSVLDAEQEIHNLSGNITGHLRIAVSHHIGLHRAPELLRRYSTTYPDVVMEVGFMDSEVAYQEVRQGSFDIAIVTLSPEPQEKIESCTVWSDPLMLAAAREHPLAKKTGLDAKKLCQYPAILPSLTTYTGKIIKQYFDREGGALDISMTTNYLETIKIMVSVGFGWSILPTTMINNNLTPLACSNFPLHRQLGYILHRERTLSNATQHLVALLKNEAGSSA